MLAFTAGSFLVPRIVRRIPAAHVMSGGRVRAPHPGARAGRPRGPGHGPGDLLHRALAGGGPGTDLIVGSAPVERAGAASAISETSSELGGALGSAVLVTVGTSLYH